MSLNRRDYISALVSSNGLSSCTSRQDRVEIGVRLLTGWLHSELSEDADHSIRSELLIFSKQLERSWNIVGRSQARLEKRFPALFEGKISIPRGSADPTSGHTTHTPTPTTRGRPRKAFEHQSARSRRRASAELSKRHSSELLVRAASHSARRDKKRDQAFVLESLVASPDHPAKMRRSLEETRKPEPERISPQKALALCVASNLTKRGYNTMRETTNDAAKFEIYPAYDRVAAAKSECHPEEITVSEHTAETSLQSLLDHTSRRIVQGLDLPESNSSAGTHRAILYVKWGFDGASGQATYKQKRASDGQSVTCEESLLCTSLVPLQLNCNGQVMWQNSMPSSTRLCRPLRIQYKKRNT